MSLDDECDCMWCFNDPSERCDSCWEACMTCQDKFYVAEDEEN